MVSPTLHFTPFTVALYAGCGVVADEAVVGFVVLDVVVALVAVVVLVAVAVVTVVPGITCPTG